MDLHYNAEVTSSGWRAISAVLQNPNSELEKLDLSCNVIGNDVLISFANSLAGNNKLKELFLDYFEGPTSITNAGWEAFCRVLCNKSSIDSTFNSNHTLERITDPVNGEIDEAELPSDLQALLQLNRGSSKVEVARRKILDVHFSGGDISIQAFIGVDLKALPHAIAWMARDEYGSSLLYTFVRNTTFFLGVDGAVCRLLNRGPETSRFLRDKKWIIVNVWMRYHAHIRKEKSVKRRQSSNLQRQRKAQGAKRWYGDGNSVARYAASTTPRKEKDAVEQVMT